MTWEELDSEFELWRADGLVLPFWWRDDDAIEHTDALARLSQLSETVNIPVHIAVIPRFLQNSLVQEVLTNTNLIPVTHGFAHQNHAAADQKKCEFSGGRALADAMHDLKEGHKVLKFAFDNRLKSLFVPPWNRFDPQFMPVLQDIGYKQFSTFTPRSKKWVMKGVEQVNTHVDPIDWRGSRSLAAGVLGHTISSLRDRRLGVADNTEPFGFLTHHLVHDDAIWTFCEAFLRAFANGPTRLWTAAD